MRTFYTPSYVPAPPKGTTAHVCSADDNPDDTDDNVADGKQLMAARTTAARTTAARTTAAQTTAARATAVRMTAVRGTAAWTTALMT